MSAEGTNSKRSGIITTIALLLFIGSVVYLSIEIGRNSRLENDLKVEKLTSEKLLSEKLSLEKDNVKLKSELKSLEENNKDLMKEIKDLTNKLASTEKGFKKSQKRIGTR